MSNTLEYEVDGSVIRTDDDHIDGRGVRTSAGLNPASAYALIRTDGGVAQSIGLEEQVLLTHGQRALFRSFESDHVNALTVDERGWEWGADEIGEADIRRISRLPDDHELYLDSDHDKPIPRGSLVRLAGHGVEHVRSRKAQPSLIEIRINGRKREVEPGSITFEQLVVLAFPTPPTGAQVSFTVSYRKGPSAHPEGSLLPGKSVHVVEGMTFHVTATDKS